MDSCETPTTSLLEQETAGFSEAGLYRTATSGADHGLVVLAMGLPYWLVEGGEGYRLLVPTEEMDAVREQLEKYERESVGWPPAPLREATMGGGAGNEAPWFLPVVWACVVMGVFVAQGRWPELTLAGAMDAVAVYAGGEVWRAVTALFLHADLGHVTSNALSGVFVFWAVASTIGRGRGWLLLALAAVAGNLAAAALHYPGAYRSVGASTAIFAGLGLLTGRAVSLGWRFGPKWRWREMARSLAVGVVVLGLYGAGDQRVDVLAHATGLAAGVVAGLVGAGAGPRREPGLGER